MPEAIEDINACIEMLAAQLRTDLENGNDIVPGAVTAVRELAEAANHLSLIQQNA